MFVQQKQLSVLNAPCSRVAKLYRSSSEIQLALPGYPSQMAIAYMVLLRGANKVQVLVGLYLIQSAASLFYTSEMGEVSPDRADQELEEGFIFAESMGFVLNDDEFELRSPADQESYWKGLPICRKMEPIAKPEGQAPEQGKTGSDKKDLKPVAAVPLAKLKPGSQESKQNPSEKERGPAPQPVAAPAPEASRDALPVAQVAAEKMETSSGAAVEPARPEAGPSPRAAVAPPADISSATPATGSPEDQIDDLLTAALDIRAAEPRLDLETCRQQLRELMGRFLASF